MLDKEIIRSALKAVKYPGFSRDIVSFGLVENISLEGNRVSVRISVTTSDPKIAPQIKSGAEKVLSEIEGVESTSVEIAVNRPKSSTPGKGSGSPAALQGVKAIIAVASGKGGVGKSTVAVNLACALEQILSENGTHDGVGILDCDIYGPSVPLMMGVGQRPEIENEKIIPPKNFGIKVMSMGLLVDESAPVVWRGPMINNAITQFSQHVEWAPLEVLVVDLPPGTGDAQLSLVQTFPVDGALIVSTPQAAAVNVARRGAKMFDKVNVPILGVCENMSYLDAGDGRQLKIFGEGGGKWAAEQLETELIAQIPLDPEIREGGDRGIPVTISYPKSPTSIAFRQMAQRLLDKINSAKS